MDNLSKATIDDSCTSMYFSFNSTSANRTVEIVGINNESSPLIGNEEVEQNTTLGAEETFKDLEQSQTEKKLPVVSSPMKAIPKRLLVTYNALSSTPTKAQLMRSVEVNRGSAAADVCELDLNFLLDNKENITIKNKENQPQISEKVCSKIFSKHIISVIGQAQGELHRIGENVNFDNSSVSKCIRNTENKSFIPKIYELPQNCEADLISVSLFKNKPRVSSTAREPDQGSTQFTEDELPQKFSSMLKISKNMSIKRKSVGNHVKPFDLLGNATKMSIVKTTLNSPARKASKKMFTPIQLKKSNFHESVIPHNHKRCSRSVIESHQNKLQLNLRKSTQSTSYMKSKKICNKQAEIKKLSSGIASDFVCKICFQKFGVFSLFENHKRSHNITSTLTNRRVLENEKQCRYCDKKFAISKALNNHLIQNCTKIPPNERKKLLFPSTSFSHVSQVTSKLPAESLSNGSSCRSPSANANKPPENSCDVKNAFAFVATVPSPSTSKIKQKLAHTGVFRTFNKQIVCHLCKLNFANILVYTQHCLSHRSTGKTN